MNKAQTDLLKRAKTCFKEAETISSDNRKKWLEDAKFCVVGEGNQWPEKIKRDRESAGLPCLEVDKLNQYRRQVVNDGRQNRPGIKARPIDSGADIKGAEAMQDLMRSICNRSNADEAFDTALDHAAKGGFGYFRVLTDYVHEHTFDQEILIRRVRNPLSVMLGPHYLADGSDAEYGFFIDEVHKDTFKRKWPKAKATNWNDAEFSDGWVSEFHVRVCEFFYKEEAPITLHRLSDGTYASDEEYQNTVANAGPMAVPEIEETRTIPAMRVKWCRLTGAEVLEERDWLGKYIPIVPVYGNEDDLEGKVIYSGLVRAGKDPQRLHNYMRSKFAERVSLTPMAPWLAEEGQIEGREDEWKNANDGTKAVLVYKAVSVDGQHALPPPQRISPTDIPAGFAEDAAMSEHDIQAAMGMYSASIGEKSNEKSGKAIMARQREGDTATFHYQDNLNRALRYLGRILIDLIPKVYDSRRVVRLLGEDGSQTEALLDPDLGVPYEQQGSQAVYNLGLGVYDVAVEAGPSYTTKRQEAAEAQMQLAQASPDLFMLIGDLMVKNMDWPGAEDISKRLKVMLPPQVQQAERDESSSPEVQAAMAAADAIKAQAEQEIAARDQMIQELQAKATSQEAALVKAQTDMFNAETERMKVEAEINKPPEQIIDNTPLELAKLEQAERESQREAETRVIVALIAANAKQVDMDPTGPPNDPITDNGPPEGGLSTSGGA